MTLKLMIKDKFGLEADTACDGLEAFNKFKIKKYQFEKGGTQSKGKKCTPNCPKQFYHLIFMDLNMPVMDGFTASTNILDYFNEKMD